MKRILSILGVTLVSASASYGQAIIQVNNIAMGINPEGHLNARDVYGVTSNASTTGVTLIGLGDATSPGCDCEGWGVSASGVSGFANVSTDGVNNLTVDSFVSDDDGVTGPGTFATSNVHVSSLPGLKVSQSYAASASSALIENKVVITNNTGGDLNDVRYVRVMDWDVPPTEFSEYVTIIGTATTADLERSHDNGFNTANPLGGDGSLDPATEDVDFVDNGPADHGAYFRFNFGTLADGETQEFSIFYGATTNEADAETALGVVGAELYSLGQQDGDPLGGTPGTFIFGFKGVGGVVVHPTPDGGASAMLLGLSLVGLGVGKRLRRK
ncbi:MAG: hypothetical protein R3F19_30885 [Verrucomicrobiales bacterium]